MKKSTKVRISPLTWVFLVFAVIMAIMAIYFCQDAVKYVTEYAESYGITVKDMGSDAIKYVMNAFFPYLVYTLIMLGFAAAMYEISKLRASLYEEPDDLDYAAAAALADEAVEEAAFEAVEADEAVEDAAFEAVEAEEAACEAEVVEEAETEEFSVEPEEFAAEDKQRTEETEEH